MSVSFATDIAEDVDEFLAGALPDACHIRARLPLPGREALGGLPHAQAVSFQLRDELRSLRRKLRPPELHLFLAMPERAHCYSETPGIACLPPGPTGTVGAPGQYAPAVRVVN